jgi:hypothetical protein
MFVESIICAESGLVQAPMVLGRWISFASNSTTAPLKKIYMKKKHIRMDKVFLIILS